MWKLASNHFLYWHFNHCFDICNYILSGEPPDAKGSLLSCKTWKKKVSLKVGGQTKTLTYSIGLWRSISSPCRTKLVWESAPKHRICISCDHFCPPLLQMLWGNGSAGKGVHICPTQSQKNACFFHLNITCVFGHKLVMPSEPLLTNSVSHMSQV